MDPETMNVDDLPAIWCPVQWELDDQERVQAVEEQAAASLLGAMCVPEAVLRLLLGETGIQRLHAAPPRFDPTQQGDWDDRLVTFGSKRAFSLEYLERTPTRLEVVYKGENLGRWHFVIEQEKVLIERI
jgi:hypothetical protein